MFGARLCHCAGLLEDDLAQNLRQVHDTASPNSQSNPECLLQGTHTHTGLVSLSLRHPFRRGVPGQVLYESEMYNGVGQVFLWCIVLGCKDFNFCQIMGFPLNHQQLNTFSRGAESNRVFWVVSRRSEARSCAAGELLEIMGSIINGFALPLKEEHKEMLSDQILGANRVIES